MTSQRSPICVVVGHVDHGKSSILDWIRHSSIVSTEKGGITQAIGASIVPIATARRICGDLLKCIKGDISISGMLFIDTPGHEAFTNLRRRGGSIADIAVVCVDINEGMKPQTKEAVEILRQFKVPFIVAANKVDLIPGWRQQDKSLLEDIKKQSEQVQGLLDTKLYSLVAQLSEHGFNADRYDRVSDFTQQIAIVPTSAKSGEGLPELLMLLIGLAQRFLEKCLNCTINGPAKGTILEVKEQKGMGCCLDVIIYDGTLSVDDTIVIGNVQEPVVTKVRALLEPADNAEMRDAKSKFHSVKSVHAATGVRISGPCLEGTYAGMPVRGVAGNLEEVKQEIAKEVAEVLLETDEKGIVIRADSLGSVEALLKTVRDQGIPIKRASVGQITRKDVLDAEANIEKQPLLGVVLGFNVAPLEDVEAFAKERGITLITDPIIYRLIERIQGWQAQKKAELEGGRLDLVMRPCKIEIMKGYLFRQSNPAIVGVDVLAGTLRSGMQLMKDNEPITTVRALQHEKESITTAEQGKQVAASLDRITMGRQVNEGDILYSFVDEEAFRKLKQLKEHLSPSEITILKEIAEKMRKDNPMWGI
ncbi:MAG: translation initiation factor IF-2 [Nanoarchaeota archaeon]